jgi:ketosteroid isomerase-like protein
MSNRFALCLLFVVILCAPAIAQENLQDQLVRQEKKLIDAINKKDKPAIRNLLSDEAMSITVIRGRQMKGDIVASLEKLSFTDYKISDVKTVRVSPDVAILSYHFTWTGGVTGQPAKTTTTYATSVWKQDGNNWRSVFYQETPRAPR